MSIPVSLCCSRSTGYGEVLHRVDARCIPPRRWPTGTMAEYWLTADWPGLRPDIVTGRSPTRKWAIGESFRCSKVAQIRCRFSWAATSLLDTRRANQHDSRRSCTGTFFVALVLSPGVSGLQPAVCRPIRPRCYDHQLVIRRVLPKRSSPVAPPESWVRLVYGWGRPSC